ncbi:MAG: hypothetical protein L3J47_10465 [Sulfurovum sp.]|nr:hypothetical protein [Sulfurovum sp.]
MKITEHDRLLQLMDELYYRPYANVVHFADDDLPLCEALAHYCVQKEYSYQLNTPDTDFFQKAQPIMGEIPAAKVFKMPLERPKFRMAGKEYEYFILTLDIDPQERIGFLKKAHDVIRSHGKIVIFLPKGDRALIDAWIADLEETLFVATSLLDDVFEAHDVILSVKMHGWGE